LLQSALRFAGFAVEVAGDVPAALASIEAGTPDAIVLDVMLPGTDGFDLLRLVRSRGVLVPVLFLTARDDVDDRIRGLKMPVLLIAGDNDLPTLEHMAKFYRLLGGGGFGDMPPGLPKSRLAILPGTSHVSAPQKKQLLLDLVPTFLDQ